MRLRLSPLVLALLVPALAYADDHNADQYAGFSGGGGGSTLWGYRHAFALESPRPSNRNLGIVLPDVSLQFGSQVTQVVFMVGPRVTIAKHEYKNKLLLQALVGGVYTNSAVAGTTNTDFAIALGVGYEFIPNEDSKWGFRVLVDRIRRFGDADDWLTRGSVGVVYRWLRRT